MNDRRLPGAVEMSTSCLTLHPSLHSGQTCAFCGWRPERGSDETATPGQVAANLASRATVPHAATALLGLQNAAQEAWVLVPEETRTVLGCLLRAYDAVPRTRHASNDQRGDQTTETAPAIGETWHVDMGGDERWCAVGPWRETKDAALADFPSTLVGPYVFQMPTARPQYEEGGWLREGTLEICPECKAAKEGTASWFLLHEKGCTWKPAGTWLAERIRSERALEREACVKPPTLYAVAHRVHAIADEAPHGPRHAARLLAIARELTELAAYGVCRHCLRAVPAECNSCAGCADERGP